METIPAGAPRVLAEFWRTPARFLVLCPECGARLDVRQPHGSTDCEDCEGLTEAFTACAWRSYHEDHVRLPPCWHSDHYQAKTPMTLCWYHGCPGCRQDDVVDVECEGCSKALRANYAAEWPEAVVDDPAGHDGEDCVHCEVCGLCRGTGQVCRLCNRCRAHEYTDGAACEQPRWDRFTRSERTFFVHSFFDKTARHWA